jgi:3-dehydroquinate dehydratase
VVILKDHVLAVIVRKDQIEEVVANVVKEAIVAVKEVIDLHSKDAKDLVVAAQALAEEVLVLVVLVVAAIANSEALLDQVEIATLAVVQVHHTEVVQRKTEHALVQDLQAIKAKKTVLKNVINL